MPDAEQQLQEQPAAEVLPDFVDLTHIGPLGLEDAHGKWAFDPCADITPLEAMLITAMLVKMLQAGRRLDWREYLTRPHPTSAGTGLVLLPDLKRHFREWRPGDDI